MFGCAMRDLDARLLTDAVGAEIRGLDVADDPEPATIVAIRVALSRHGVVVFRLCISPEVMSHIVGMDREGALALALARALARHALADRFVYRHRWRAGDLVIWDNRCTMHTATVFDANRYRRLLYRTIIS